MSKPRRSWCVISAIAQKFKRANFIKRVTHVLLKYDSIRIAPILLGPSSGSMYHNFRATFSQDQLRISQPLLDTRSIKRESSLEDNFTPSESKNDGSSIGFK